MKIKYDLLKTFMSDNGYKYYHLADMIGCSKAFMWQIVNGKRRLTYEMAILIASIFNITPDDIFYSEHLKDKATNNKIKEVIKRRDEIQEKNK